MSSSTVDTKVHPENKKLDDLEVKDAQFIFNSVWMMLQQEFGEENLHFPKEIFWLNGAPGAGKGTNTNFIMRFRNFTAPPLVVSELLKSPEARKKIDAGMLVGDREVIHVILRNLLKHSARPAHLPLFLAPHAVFLVRRRGAPARRSLRLPRAHKHGMLLLGRPLALALSFLGDADYLRN